MAKTIVFDFAANIVLHLVSYIQVSVILSFSLVLHNLSLGSKIWLVVSFCNQLIFHVCQSGLLNLRQAYDSYKLQFHKEARFLSDIRFHADYKGVCPTVNKTIFDVSAKAGLRIRTVFPLQAVSLLSQFDCLSCTQS